MRKVYRYKNLDIEINGNEEIEFGVQFLTSGNIAQTLVNIPGDNDPEIADSGVALIGTKVELKNELIVCATDVANIIPQVDTIAINYTVNGKTILEHRNDKSEEDRPIIVLFIKII